jgi:hypothetical protein
MAPHASRPPPPFPITHRFEIRAKIGIPDIIYESVKISPQKCGEAIAKMQFVLHDEV